MRLKEDVHLSDFLSAVGKCRGSVTFHTMDGDHLDLKSLLSCLVFASAFIQKPETCKSWISLSDASDFCLLEAYLQKETQEEPYVPQ